MRILALVPGGIGDQILFFPTLDHLKHNYSQAQIDVAVEPRAKGAYRVSDAVHSVLSFDYENRNGPADWSNFIGSVREREYDAVIASGRDPLVGPLLWLMGIPKRVGYAGRWGQWFLTDPVPLKPKQYIAHMYHDLLQGLGIHTPCPELTVQIPVVDQEWAQAEQQRLGLGSSQDYLIIHAGSSRLAQQEGIDRLYSIAGWQAVLQGIKERYPQLSILVIQSPGSTTWTQELTPIYPNLEVLIPQNIGQLAAIIEGAKGMLCTDSAAMHLGVAVQTKVVAMFGSTDPEKLLPKKAHCTGLKSPTGKMADIPPIQIVEQIEID